MKKKIFLLICLLIFSFAIFKFSFKENTKVKNIEVNEEEQYIDTKLSKMTLREKIAQMLILYYYNDTVSNSLKDTIKNVKPGGFILFDENISDYNGTVNFVKTLQENSEIPLFISIDQEGGIVQRFNYLKDMKVTKIPSMYNLGLTKDENLAYDVGRVIAEELRVIGVNMDFAPVLDIYSNPKNKVIGTRSFSNDKKIVSKMAISLSKGLSDNGVIPVFKHFPGHGDTEVDSHYSLPIINKSKTELLNGELIPFVDAIKSGAQVIMIGHICIPKISNDTPASLSKEIVTDLLKEELGYNGLVVTDALNMGAVTKNYSQSEILEMAINAGVDLLLMPGDSKTTIDSIENSVKRGKISDKLINESVKKILTFKYSSLNGYKYLDSGYLNNIEHKEIISRIK